MTSRTARIPAPIVVFVAVYMLVFGVLALRQGNTEFLVYTGAMFAFLAFVYVLHRTLVFTTLALTLLAIWGALHMGGGTVPIPAHLAETESNTAVLYSLRLVAWLPRYDQVTHAFGFFAATVACGEFLVRTHAPRSRLALGFGAAMMGMGFGALNEVLEFIVTLVVPEHNVGGYVNTGWDLVSNTVGATAGGIATAIRSLLPRDTDWSHDERAGSNGGMKDDS